MIYKKFVNETMENGMLKDISFNIPQNFNFAFDVVDELAKTKPDKKAMIWLSVDKEKKEFTFRDIARYSSMVANYFKSLGIKKGDRVMLILKRHYEFWFSIIALHKIGAITIPATHLLMKKDLDYRFERAGVKAVVCTSCDEVSDEVDKCENKVLKIIAGKRKEGWNFFDDAYNESDVFERPQGEEATCAKDLMLMYFTSGTTGYPKIAAHDFTYPLGHVVTAVWWHNVDENGVHFTISDTGWGKAVWGKLYGQWLAETCVFVYDFDRFHAEDILPLFKQYNITTFCAPPTMYRFFIKEDLSKYDLSGLQYCTIAGEALNPEVFKQFYNATGIKLMEGFGQTETTLTVANLRGMEPKPGSMGKPNPQYKVVMINGEGKECEAGEEGEVCVDTTNGNPVGIFSCYYKDPENTANAWHDGLYHTGDMAWKDEDGYLWYVGRTDDLIKSSGYRIGPFEIESVLMEHPSVLECAVTGAPDPIRGQVVKATIVLAKGYSASEELAQEIKDYVKKLTAPYKYPRIVEFVDELPKTISGKIRRVEIKNKSEKNS